MKYSKPILAITAILYTSLFFNTNVYAQKNLTLRSQLSMFASGIWGYVDSLGNEYALVGNGPGLSIVDVTDPDTAKLKFTVPGYGFIWTEVRTWDKYAYVTNEQGNSAAGLVIVDMSNLPDSINYKTWQGNGAISGQLHTCHSLHIDNGYMYLNGCDAGDMIIVDLADPWNPNYVGTYNNYVHDCYVRNDTVWTAEIYSGVFKVLDVTDKTNPIPLATQPTPGNFTHNTWLSDDSKTLFTTDEVGGGWLVSYDVSDISNIQELDRYQTTINSNEEVHNVRVLNDFLVNACFGSQVTIVDAARPDNLIEIGHHATGSSLCWDVYPFLPSGNIIAADNDNGLYVFTPSYVRACYLEGVVRDSITGALLNNVTIEILLASIVDSTGLTGEYKTGVADQGTYNIQFSKPGYITKIVSGVILDNGVLTTLDVKLWDGVSGIDQVFSANPNIEIIIYPNPFNSSTTFEITRIGENKPFTFVLYNIIGEQVKEVSHITGNKFIIRREGLPVGIYIYNINFKKGLIGAGKLVVH